MMKSGFPRLLLSLLMVLAFVLAPVRLAVSPSGLAKIKQAMALAESGPGSDGDGRDDDDDDDDDEPDDDDEEDDDQDDDQDDSEDDDEGDDGPDDEDDDEGGHSGPGSSGSGTSSGKNTSDEDRSSYRPSGPIARIELSRSGVKIRYADGAREEIESGRYELRDASGRRVTRRRATGADIARLKAVSTGVSIRSVTRRDTRPSDIRNVTSTGGKVSVAYTNGWNESIAGGTYQLTDPYGRTVAKRPATAKDRSRLTKLARGN